MPDIDPEIEIAARDLCVIDLAPRLLGLAPDQDGADAVADWLLIPTDAVVPSPRTGYALIRPGTSQPAWLAYVEPAMLQTARRQAREAAQAG